MKIKIVIRKKSLLFYKEVDMEYRIKSDTFELADIFECGQCFRWNKEENGSYTGVFYKNVLNVDKKR